MIACNCAVRTQSARFVRYSIVEHSPPRAARHAAVRLQNVIVNEIEGIQALQTPSSVIEWSSMKGSYGRIVIAGDDGTRKNSSKRVGCLTVTER